MRRLETCGGFVETAKSPQHAAIIHVHARVLWRRSHRALHHVGGCWEILTLRKRDAEQIERVRVARLSRNDIVQDAARLLEGAALKQLYGLCDRLGAHLASCT